MPNEIYLALCECPAYLPGLVATSTVRHWTKRGLRRNGETVRLRVTRVGHKVLTRLDWLQEFIEICGGELVLPDVPAAAAQ
jgi:hypothetical protein